MLPLNHFAPFLQHTAVFLLMASEGEEHLTLWQQIEHSNVFNVLLVAIILGFLVKKFNLLGGIEGQRKKIAAEIETIEIRKKQALEQLEEAQRLTRNLKSEVDEILGNARQSAESMSNQILNDARNESAKIIENAKKRVELEQRSAIKDLERRLLNDALSEARTELANNLNGADQKRSVETFLNELSELKGAQRS